MRKHTQWKEMSQTVQDLKVEIKSRKETQTEGNLETKNLRTPEAVLISRIQEMEALKT